MKKITFFLLLSIIAIIPLASAQLPYTQYPLDPGDPIPEVEICNGADDDGDGKVDEGDLCEAGHTCNSGTCEQVCVDRFNVDGDPATGNLCGIDGVAVGSVGSDGCTDVAFTDYECEIPNTYCVDMQDGTYTETHNGWTRTYEEWSFDCQCQSGSLETYYNDDDEDGYWESSKTRCSDPGEGWTTDSGKGSGDKDDEDKYCPATGDGKTIVKGDCVDTTAPDTTDNTDNSWHKNSQDVSLSCDDSIAAGNGGSGCNKTFYCVDNEPGCDPDQNGKTLTVPESSEGVNYLRYYSIDNSQNSSDEEVRSTKVKIDDTDPVTSDNSTGKWHNSTSRTVELTCDDPENPGASGCNKIYYCKDQSNTCDPETQGGATTQESKNLKITKQGQTYIRYLSEDVAGNKEPLNSTVVKIDRSKPRVYIGEDVGSEGLRQITVFCRDEYSGCNLSSRRLKVSSPSEYSGECPEDIGEYTEGASKKISELSFVCATAEDKLGHRSIIESPIEIEEGTISAEFSYRSSNIQVLQGRVFNVLYRVENLKDSEQDIYVELEGPEAELPGGKSEKQITLNSGEEKLIPVKLEPQEETEKLIINLTNTETGQSIVDTLQMKATKRKNSAMEAPGLGGIQLMVLLISAFTIYIKRP